MDMDKFKILNSTYLAYMHLYARVYGYGSIITISKMILGFAYKKKLLFIR